MVVFVLWSWFMPEPWDASFPLQRESPESPQGRCSQEGHLPLALLVRGHPRSSQPGLPGLPVPADHNSRAVLLSFGARGSTHPAPLSSPEPALAGIRGDLQAAVVSWVHRQCGQMVERSLPSPRAVILVVPALLGVKRVLSLVYACSRINVFSLTCTSVSCLFLVNLLSHM